MTGSKYQHVIASGCSFTQDGIGGIPPTKQSPEGGNSYTHNPDLIVRTWAGYVAKQLNALSFFNLATSGRGNYHTYLTLLYTLMSDRYLYNKENTLVLFNITDIGRLDLPVPYNSSDSSVWSFWDVDQIPFKFHKDPVQCYKIIQQEQAEVMSVLAIRSLIDFLENSKFEYRFVLMQNYLKDIRIKSIICNNPNLVLTPDGGMMEYVITNNITVSETDHHPNIKGHEEIGTMVLTSLEI